MDLFQNSQEFLGNFVVHIYAYGSFATKGTFQTPPLHVFKTKVLAMSPAAI